MKSLFRFILFVGIGTLIAALIELILKPLKTAGLPSWIGSILTFSIYLTIGQLFLILKSAKTPIFSPTVSADFSGLKLDLLASYTKDLELLGFAEFADYQVANFTPRIFLRIFSNPERQCSAIISQTSSGLMKCTIQSFFTDGWSLANFAFRTDTYRSCSAQIWSRHPRLLWMSQPDPKLERILATHLQRRQQLERDLSIEIIHNPTVGTYFEYEQQVMQQYHRNLKRKWIVVAMIQAVRLYLQPKTEWMGEYQARLDVLKNSAF